MPGEGLAKVAYRVIEPDVFAGKRVLVVGGGNAAADCVIALAEAGRCASVGLSYRRPALARLRGPLRTQLDRLFRERVVVPYLSTEVVEIAPEHVVLRSQAGEQRLANDAVVVQIGGTTPTALLKSIGIELIEKRGAA